jgi:hypothetical protein
MEPMNRYQKRNGSQPLTEERVSTFFLNRLEGPEKICLQIAYIQRGVFGAFWRTLAHFGILQYR